jgi:hypothetical protein
MKRSKIAMLLFVALMASCNNSDNKKKGSEGKYKMLKSELALEKKANDILNKEIPQQNSNFSNIKQIESDIEKIDQLMNIGSTVLEIDSNGAIKYDSGTASTGRFEGSLKNMELSLKLKKNIPKNERDGNPSESTLAVIYLDCNNNKKCLEDNGLYGTASIISFDDQSIGERVFELLNAIQNNLKEK